MSGVFARVKRPSAAHGTGSSAQLRGPLAASSAAPRRASNQAVQSILRAAGAGGETAQGPETKGAGPTGPRFSPECTSYHRCTVIEPLVHARQLVDAALKALPPIAAGTVTTGRIIDLLNVHFHTASAPHAATILDRFRAIRAELDAPIRYVCHLDSPPDCESTASGFVGGFTTCAGSADIHLCSSYYVLLTCAEKARVLVHEVAHHVPGVCRDHAYVGDSKYMTLAPDQAMANADTYAQFANMVFLGAPSCVDCAFEIQRPGGRRY